MRNVYHTLNIVLVSVLSMVPQRLFGQLSSYSKNDPYPMYTIVDPHTFLYNRVKQVLKGEDPIYECPEYFAVHVSPFAQFATCAKDLAGCNIALGDINGRWSMISLLFGHFPEGVDTYPSEQLSIAQQHLYPEQRPGFIEEPEDIRYPCPSCSSTVNPDGSVSINCVVESATGDTNLGFITIPLYYRKWGLRTEFDFQITRGLGILMQLGVADITQMLLPVDCPQGGTCCTDATKDADFIAGVKSYLTCQYKKIAEELCLEFAPFHKTAIEDFRAIGYWRRAFPVNTGREEWPLFLAIPFTTLGGTFASGKAANPSDLFTVSFGNNGHNSVGASLGIDIDFAETLEFGGEVGLTHFFSREVCNMRIPTSPYQYGIYPFATTAVVCPGANWHFGLKLQAWHFLEHLSCYFEYMVIQHRRDKIHLKKCDPAFLPDVLEDRSWWQAQLGNVGFYYDISPSITWGFLWQIPFAQKNVYRSSTLLFSFVAYF